MTSDDALLALHGVTVRFGGLVALRDVSMSVAPGTIVGVIGPNGAGKTTLFNVVCGLVRPERGRLVWRGRDLRRHRPDRLAGLGIARTLQGLGLFRGLSVLENVMAGATRHARAGLAAGLLGAGRTAHDERDLADRAMAALAALDVAELAGRYPGSLPYGQQKRVALARALVAEPDLLLMDEPVSGLSTAEMDEFVGHIGGLRERMAVVLVEHHMDLVMRVCDRVVVFNFGEVISAGTPEQVQADPVVTEAYLGQPTEESTSA
ncbi:ABC transporter ATP-binding protein [Actinophytocola sp.]|uniref:ABC transporter ATP-binding protein n=1 Tax=Actinophytocola sp. TaxID=1872138 RepID=UPI0039C8B2E1